MFAIINDAAQAYKGVIPDDRWHEPYMSLEEIEKEIADGVEFWGAEEGGALVGVMGAQDKGEVTLDAPRLYDNSTAELRYRHNSFAPS